MADVDASRAAQREIYGEPLGVVVDRCRATLGLTQGRVAALLGISAPMLSQLVSGQRIKIGNPSAVERLRVMVEVTDAVAGGRLPVADAITRIEAAGAPGEVLTGATTRRASARETAEQVQSLFRRVASAPDYLAAADQVADAHPEIAELLRVYGAGRTDDAVAHLLG
ncbi:helix-turn-helix domain-containing protein [Jiangella endophytica]|uniref:helix-turn-helix domain-containing protein n=1 Tax=Jiangella endophytica TaxID=1623398 RepID=UPI001E6093FE|nr:helix-turn-helix transcriptional regulator [Jiangella endophytica]